MLRAMLELAILGLLKEQPMHGYDLRKRLRSGFGLLATLSFGSLYPALARLEQAGAVREYSASVADPLPLTGSLSGERAAFRLRSRLAARAPSPARGGRTRERKVYEITEEGETMFARLLGEQSSRKGDDKTFAVRWAFARYLSNEARLGLLEHQRRRLADRLSEAEAALGSTGPALDRYERQLAEHAVESLAKDLAWIDSLMAAEESASAGDRAEVGDLEPLTAHTEAS